jgi:hypothetical protein
MAEFKAYGGNNTKYKGGFQSSSIGKPFNIPYSVSAQQIGAMNSVISGTATIYTIPADFTFFITGYYLQAINFNAAGVNERGRLYFGSQLVERIYSGSIATGSTAFISHNLTFPFILRSNETITIQSESGAGLTLGGITGFLVPNNEVFSQV